MLAHASNGTHNSPFPTNDRRRGQIRCSASSIWFHYWVTSKDIMFLGWDIYWCGPRPQSAEQVYGWITRHLPDGPKPRIYRPLNYVRIVATTTIILGAVSFLSIASPYILPILQNRNLWAAISLIIILLFTSGHMFNHIRKVPYVSGDGRGGISYFAGGFSSQFGLETQIVAAICMLFLQTIDISTCFDHHG